MEERDTRLLKGTLDICLLAMIEEKDCYGYEMISTLRDKGFPLANERSVYPLLGRLELDGLIEGYLQASNDGPARKYYRIQPEGCTRLRERARRTFEIYELAREIVTERVDLEQQVST
ncbi:PadR family transcriptional regulator [Rubrobacter aplysinae]|uniref:PadR family transcriptional regulator n=1 Tax=Rubrobacter aplysinae TaxID=909625 RepID=UPI00069E8AC5|nr:PadR family transcriptional regulator [Rubrobacter aplysinae]